MATLTVYSAASDAQIGSANGTYATARSGGTLTVTNGSNAGIGQGEFFGYNCYESFVDFDTSPLGSGATISTAVLSLYGQATNLGSNNGWTVNARFFDFGTSVTTADWIAGASLSGNTLGATFGPVSGWSTAAYNDFTSQAGQVGGINTTGNTRYVLSSTRHEGNNTPATGKFETVNFYTSEDSGTTRDPKLVVTYTSGSTVTFDAGLAGAASLTDDFVRTRSISAALTGVGTVSAGQVRQSRVFRASPAGAASLSAALGRTRPFQVAVAGAAAVAEALKPIRPFAGAPAGAATVTAADVRSRNLTASPAGALAVTADFKRSRVFQVSQTNAAGIITDFSVGGKQVFAGTPAGVATVTAAVRRANRSFTAAQAGGAVLQGAFVRSVRSFVAGPAGSATVDVTRGDSHIIIEGVPMIGINLTPNGATSATGRYQASGLDQFDIVGVMFTRVNTGGTPAISWTVEGSPDGTNWYTLAYVVPNSTTAASAAAQTTTGNGQTLVFVDGLNIRRFPFIAINVASNTNQPFTAQLLVEDHE